MHPPARPPAPPPARPPARHPAREHTCLNSLYRLQFETKHTLEECLSFRNMR